MNWMRDNHGSSFQGRDVHGQVIINGPSQPPPHKPRTVSPLRIACGVFYPIFLFFGVQAFAALLRSDMTADDWLHYTLGLAACCIVGLVLVIVAYSKKSRKKYGSIHGAASILAFMIGFVGGYDTPVLGAVSRILGHMILFR